MKEKNSAFLLLASIVAALGGLLFGFDTAVSFATEAIDRLHTTAEAHHRVMVVEVMGRYAGWIALYAGVAGGADVILIPEIPYTMAAICAKIEQRRRTGRNFSIVVVAESVRGPVGEAITYKDAHGQSRYGGIGEMIAAGFVANGAKVYISSRKEAACNDTARRLTEHYGGQCIPLPGNVASLDGIDALAAALRGAQRHGGGGGGLADAAAAAADDDPGGRVQRHVGAEVPREVALLRRRRCGDDPGRTHLAGQLDGEGADAAVAHDDDVGSLEQGVAPDVACEVAPAPARPPAPAPARSGPPSPRGRRSAPEAASRGRAARSPSR